MQCILSALKYESAPFIKHFGLRKDKRFSYPVFTNGKIYILSVGVGKKQIEKRINNFRENINQNFIQFINIGSAGGKKDKHKIGEAFLINKITDDLSKTTYYPDILFKHPFKEIGITTVEKGIVDGGNNFHNLVDMEASEIFRVCTKFSPLHNIFFLKIVSDHMNVNLKKIDKEYLPSLITYQLPDIDNFLQSIEGLNDANKSILIENDKEWITDTVKTLKLTETQGIYLKNFLKGYRLRKPNVRCPTVKEYQSISISKRNKIFQDICEKLTS